MSIVSKAAHIYTLNYYDEQIVMKFVNFIIRFPSYFMIPLIIVRYKIEIVKFWATTELDTYARMSRVSIMIKKANSITSQQSP